MAEVAPRLSELGGVPAYVAGREGPAVVVLQEYWGVVPQICGVADRLAASGFRAAVPDLYGGATTDDRAAAAGLMGGLDVRRALEAIVAVRRALDDTGPAGCVGFCMGGGLALLCASAPSAFQATVAFYGLASWEGVAPAWGPSGSPLQLHFASEDTWATVEEGRRLVGEATAAGQPAELHTYAGSQHGFVDETRPESHDPRATEQAWSRATRFLRAHLTTTSEEGG